MSDCLQRTGNLTIISQHFHPSTAATAQLITDLATGLASKGHQVQVLTETPHSGEELTDLFIARSPFSGSANTNIFSKSLNGLIFVVWSLFKSITHSRTDEVILVVSNPPFIAIVGLIVRLLLGVKYIFVLQDLFPRSAQLTGVLPARGPVSNAWVFVIQQVCKYSYKTIVLSHSMRSRCLSQFQLPSNKVTVIHNWAVEQALPIEKDQNPIAREWSVNNTFTIQYSGNFGRLHEIITLLETARILEAENFHFLFVGGGAKRSQICEYIQYYKLTNVSLHPYQDRSRLPYSLGACDVAAIGLIPGSEDTVAPSKFYGIISSGKPVLLLARHSTEIAKLIKANECGIVLDPGDPVGVADSLRYLNHNPQILQRLSANARKTYSQHFGIDKSLQAYNALISELFQASE